MTVQAAVSFASFFLENQNALAFYKTRFPVVAVRRNYFTYYFCAFYGRSPDGYFAIFVYQKHSVKLENRTVLGTQVMNKQFLAVFDFELLSLNLYDYVHLYYSFRFSLPGGVILDNSFSARVRISAQSYDYFISLPNV